MSSKLAINGGVPVRKEALPGAYPGASVYGQEEIDAITEVIKRKSPFRYYGVDVAGKAEEFEGRVCERLGRKFALASSSGTSALIIALVAAGIGSGDKVIIPANTFYATAGAVIAAGAVPVYCDIDDSMNLDPTKIEALIDEDVKALVVVPILGNSCDMDPIMEICSRRKITLIEDNAQSWGSTYKGKPCGSFGAFATYSLQLNKMITAGEGGVVVTDRPEYIERATRFHDQGTFRKKQKYEETKNQPDQVLAGQNYRLSEVAGAIACEQIKKLDMIIENLRRVKQTIKNGIQPTLEAKGVTFRRITDADGDVSNTIMMYMPSPEKAVAFRNAMLAENINCTHLYDRKTIYAAPSLLEKKPADKNGFPFNQFTGAKAVHYEMGMCPKAEDLLSRNVMIPLAPVFTEKDCQDVIEGVLKVAEEIL